MFKTLALLLLLLSPGTLAADEGSIPEDPYAVRTIYEKDAYEEDKKNRAERFKEISKEHGSAFQKIPFGASKSDAFNELRDTFGPTKINEYKNLVWLEDFSLGEISVRVYFNFNHKGKLYKLSFDTGYQSANKIDSVVRSEADFLTNVFRNKYGNPVKCQKPAFYDIKDGYITFLCEWQNPNLNVYTGLGVNDSQYYASGVVASKPLMGAYETYKKEEKKKKAAEGAVKF